jgi:tetratricopeptide (TPR) repeat protein
MNEREQVTLAAQEQWGEGAFLAAVGTFEDLLARWPRDLLALKALEFLYYVLGQQHMGPRFRSTVEALADANADDADFLGVRSFATELAGEPERAADLAEAALAIEPCTPWAHHALAHVFITRGDPPEAVARLEQLLPMWATCGRVIHAHNAWHLAVAHLDQLELDRAEAVYRDHIWGFVPDSPGEQIDAISYLWRVELAGHPVDDGRWADLADHVRPTSRPASSRSSHHAYALAAPGDDALPPAATVAHRSTAAMPRPRCGSRSASRSSSLHRPCAAISRPAAPRSGDARVTEVGGSDAQDDLFRLATSPRGPAPGEATPPGGTSAR